MKKIIVLIFAVILAIVTYNFYESKSTIAEQTKYRIEDKNGKEDLEVAINSEEELTTYINEINEEVITVTSKENISESDKITLKNIFITLTDFIFYNGKLKGQTFNQLTVKSKEKIISLYEKIDNKIDEKIPGYKETLKDNSTKTYNDINEKLTKLKEEVLTLYREEIGEENYNDQNELLEESISTIKESVSPVIDKIAEKSKEVYNNTKEKADTWYKNWKEGNAQ